MMRHPNDDFSVWLAMIVVSLILLLILFVATTAKGDDRMSARALEVKELQMEEGFRGKPYKDTTGNWTVGYGHNLEGRSFKTNELVVLFKGQVVPHTTEQYIKYWEEHPMSKDEAEYILEADIAHAENYTKVVYRHVWDQISEGRQAALVDLMFNLGYNTYRKFKKHIAATKELDWDKSADEVLNSRAAKQNKKRYEKISKRLRGEDE